MIIRRPRARLSTPSEVQSAPPRVRRTRPVTVAQVGKLPYFTVDYRRPLSWKFSIFMVASFLYYTLNRSIITDADYDSLCRELEENYRGFTHPHKHLVSRGHFAAGTGYDIHYPLMVQHAAMHMLGRFSER